MIETGCARPEPPGRVNDRPLPLPLLLRRRRRCEEGFSTESSPRPTSKERLELPPPLPPSNGTLGSVALEIVTSAAVTVGEMLTTAAVPAAQLPLAHCAIAWATAPDTDGSLCKADTDMPLMAKLHDTPQLHGAGGGGRRDRHEGSLAWTMAPSDGEHAVPRATSRT